MCLQWKLQHFQNCPTLYPAPKLCHLKPLASCLRWAWLQLHKVCLSVMFGAAMLLQTLVLQQCFADNMYISWDNPISALFQSLHIILKNLNEWYLAKIDTDSCWKCGIRRRIVCNLLSTHLEIPSPHLCSLINIWQIAAWSKKVYFVKFWFCHLADSHQYVFYTVKESVHWFRWFCCC